MSFITELEVGYPPAPGPWKAVELVFFELTSMTFVSKFTFAIISSC